MANKYTHKASGRKMSLEEAAAFLGVRKELFSLAIVPRKNGGARSKDEIMSLCMANACRTVSTFCANISPDDIASKAAILLKKSGYYVEVDKNGSPLSCDPGQVAKEYFYKRLQSPKSPFGWYDEMSHHSNPKTAAIFARKFLKLEAEGYQAVETAVDTCNPAKLASFLKKWKYKQRIDDFAYTFAKKIDTEAVESGKLQKKPKRYSRKTIIVPKKEIDKFVANAKKRWGAFGAMFFQLGREFNPKLRLGTRTETLGEYKTSISDRIGNAPVAKKFPRRFYERANGYAGGMTASAQVVSRYVENRSGLRGALEKMCKTAEKAWSDKAEKALMILFDFEI